MKFKGLSVLLVSSLLAGCFGSNQLTLRDMKSRDIIVDVTTPVDVERKDAIEYYRSLLEFDIDNRYRIRAMKRLADLELEAGEQRETLDRAILSVGEIEEYERSIKTYHDLLRTYPNHEGTDVVLYQLARAYERLGMMEESMESLTQLVHRYPSSPLYDEVQFRRGEIYFIDAEFEKSAEAYQSVIQYGEASRFYYLALHKHGWNFLKMDKFEGALDSFFALLDMKLGTKVLGEVPFSEFDVDQSEQELISDTLYAVSLVFSYLNDIDYVDEYISKRGRQNYDFAVYETLAEFYLKQLRYHEAAGIYTHFAVRYAEAPQAAFFKQRVIDLYIDAERFPDFVLSSKKHYVQVYGPNTPFWLKYSENVRSRLKPNIRAHLTELTEYYHALAQKDRSLKDYHEAETWYWAFLKSLPEDPEVPQFHFLLADLIFEQGRFAEAAKEYEHIAYEYEGFERGQEAGYAAILSHREHLKRLQGEEQTKWRERQVASVLKYTEAYPSDPRLARVMTGVAEESFQSQDFEKAWMLAQRVTDIEEGVSDELRLSAWTVTAHIEFERGNYIEAEKAYQHVLGLAKKGNKLDQKHFEWLAASIYKQGEEKREDGELLAATVDFLRMSKTIPPGVNTRIKAEYDAGSVFMELKAWNKAIRVFEYFFRSYKNHQLVVEIPFQLATAYSEIGQPLKAAAQYNLIASNLGYRTDVRQEAAWQAAEIYQENDKHAESIKAYEDYLTTFSEPFEKVVEARHQLMKLYAFVGQRGKHDNMLKQLVLGSEPTKATHTPRSRYLVAQAALSLAESKMEEFRTVRLVEPLQVNLASKKTRMEDALDAYNQAAQYEVADVVTASTFRIGEIYQQFSNELMDSERPQGLNEEELEEYDILLEEQAYPFEEKAISILESNAQRSSEGYYDSWVKKSFSKLKELVPARYSKSEKGAEIIYELN
ncbi:tol-pal system YbgF family protein [Pseudomonadota bacterium]